MFTWFQSINIELQCAAFLGSHNNNYNYENYSKRKIIIIIIMSALEKSNKNRLKILRRLFLSRCIPYIKLQKIRNKYLSFKKLENGSNFSRYKISFINIMKQKFFCLIVLIDYDILIVEKIPWRLFYIL